MMKRRLLESDRAQEREVERRRKIEYKRHFIAADGMPYEMANNRNDK